MDEELKMYASAKTIEWDTDRHKPRRDDDIAQWLKRWRDRYEVDTEPYRLLDDLLNEYRTRADFGYTMNEHVEGHL